MSRKKFPESILGHNILQARKIIGVSQKEFCEKIGISAAHISRIEKNKGEASPILLYAIEHIWGISKSWLETGEGPMLLKPPETWLDKPLNIANRPHATDDRLPDFVRRYDIWWAEGGKTTQQVNDDAMDPIILSGDLVGVNLNRRDPMSLLGSLVAASLEESVLIRTLRKSGETWILMPNNDEFEPIIRRPGELLLIGAVEWIWREISPIRAEKAKDAPIAARGSTEISEEFKSLAKKSAKKKDKAKPKRRKKK